MAESITIYNFNKDINSTKIPTTALKTLSVVCKDPTNIYTPVFTLQFETASDKSYRNVTYIGWESRYYFVTDMTYESSSVMSFICKLDLLATYRSNIANFSTRYVVCPTSLGSNYESANGFISDIDMPSSAYITSITNDFSLGFIADSDSDLTCILQTDYDSRVYIMDATAFNYIYHEYIKDDTWSGFTIEFMSQKDVTKSCISCISFSLLNTVLASSKIETGVIRYSNKLGTNSLSVPSGNIFSVTQGVFLISNLQVPLSNFSVPAGVKKWQVTMPDYSQFKVSILGTSFYIPNNLVYSSKIVGSSVSLNIKTDFSPDTGKICSRVYVDYSGSSSGDRALLGTADAYIYYNKPLVGVNTEQAALYQLGKSAEIATKIVSLGAVGIEASTGSAPTALAVTEGMSKAEKKGVLTANKEAMSAYTATKNENSRVAGITQKIANSVSSIIPTVVPDMGTIQSNCSDIANYIILRYASLTSSVKNNINLYDDAMSCDSTKSFSISGAGSVTGYYRASITKGMSNVATATNIYSLNWNAQQELKDILQSGFIYE